MWTLTTRNRERPFDANLGREQRTPRVMARRAALDRQTLIALGPERLADLLLDLANADPALKRQLRLAVASGANPTDAATLVRERLGTIRRGNTFLKGPQIKALAKELDQQLDAITGPIAAAEPAAAFTLLWEFLDLSDSVFARCIDRSGVLSDLFRSACRQLGPLALAAQPDPEALAEQVFNAFCDNGYGIYDPMIASLTEALGPQGLQALKQRFEQLAQEPVPIPPEAVWEAVSWGSGGTRYAHQVAEQARQWAVRDGLQAVAQAMGDVDGYISQFSEEQRRAPRIAAGIAQRLLKADRPEDALQALEFGKANRSGWPVFDWEDAHIATLEALGRSADAQTARWQCFARCLRSTYLEDFLQRLPDFEDVEAEQRAIDLAAEHPMRLEALCFLLNWPSALGRAAELIVQRRDSLDGDQYTVFGPAAEKLSADYPLAATLALRCMVEFTLTHARSSRYSHAANHLHTCQLLSQRITNWGEITPHDTYVAAIRSQHARKSGFWSKAKPLGL